MQGLYTWHFPWLSLENSSGIIQSLHSVLERACLSEKLYSTLASGDIKPRASKCHSWTSGRQITALCFSHSLDLLYTNGIALEDLTLHCATPFSTVGGGGTITKIC
ncbi:unnamed protein product [Meganyctiphanes norvegica]|uniref:Uncharacterized protein n=1 Tax=Meganyctiphanes norvegica TaxID=48144 RepID=A0AAV2R9U7_MEGNR